MIEGLRGIQQTFKRHLGMALILSLIAPSAVIASAPVVDDSQNYAMLNQNDPEALAFDDSSQSANGTDEPLAKEMPAPESSGAALRDTIQGLQQELQELRGQMNAQADALKQLQEQQLKFYKDLDARLGQNVPPTTAIAPSQATKPTTPSSAHRAARAVTPTPAKPMLQFSRVNPADEEISYLAAYELIKNKHFEQALPAMQAFVARYPRGGYAANAEYWLGELYLTKKDYANALSHFNVVSQDFPQANKNAESALKAGYALAALGKRSEAIARLKTVILEYPDTPVARLAQEKLTSI